MKLDIRTLAFILSLTCISQVIAIYIQYRVNKLYRGIEWWLLGSFMMSAGFICLWMGTFNTIGKIGVIGNPLLILGRMCLFVGTIRFVGKRENIPVMALLAITSICIYYYYLFGRENLSGRTIVVSSVILLFSVMISYQLFFNSNKSFLGSAKFTGTIFMVHGSYLILLIIYTLLSQPIRSYIDFAPVQVAAFVVPTITSTLWTFGFILMINQRLSAENHEEKLNLQHVFNAGPDASMILRRPDGVFVDINMGFTVMSGYEREEIMGKSLMSVGIWREKADCEKFMLELREKGSCENMEMAFQRKDGTQLVGMISAKTITINAQPHIISVIRDITERKSAEEALRESEETYRSILKASPDDITITDLEGRVLLVSPAANAMFGYEPGDGEGMRVQDFILPEDVERAESDIKLMHQVGHPGPNEYRGVRKDGGVFDIEVNSGFIRGQHGRPIKMVFIVRDITGRRQAEAERARLEGQNRQLQKAESLSLMAGAIAHHFNNKLQTVMSNLEVLGGGAGGANLASHLSKAKQATEGAAAISRLMLVYLGQASDHRDPHALSLVCQDALRFTLATMPEGRSVEVDWPSPGPIVSVNPDQIHQVMANLVVNAWEASAESRGAIRLSLSTCAPQDIPGVNRFPIDWHPQLLDHACLEVADQGHGIADADIEKVFDPFFSTKFSGRGLGLPVVLGIVQAHGGAVTVTSSLGQGSVFRVYLPITSALAPKAAERVTQALKPRTGRVLLVDDDEDLLLSTAEMIGMMGHTTLTAKDGVEAMEVFQRHQGQIDCVITDLTMPRMDGWATLAALRQLEPNLPVILMSGYDKAQVMSGSHLERPQGFLGKPYRLQDLRGALEQAMAFIET